MKYFIETSENSGISLVCDYTISKHDIYVNPLSEWGVIFYIFNGKKQHTTFLYENFDNIRIIKES